jgi:alpha-N-arabinofuranosidase
VAWDAQGWPHVNGDRPLALEMSGAGLPPSHPWIEEPVRDDFDAPHLALPWEHLRTASLDTYSLTERPGALRLKGGMATLDDVASPAFVARRQEHLRMRAATRVSFAPVAESQVAGLVLRQDEANHYEVRVAGGIGARWVELVTRVKGVASVVRASPIEAGDVTLQVEAFPDRYEFSYGVDRGALKPLGSAPTRPLASEETGGFTGVFVGMYASGPAPMPPADFDWFDYEPLDK